jgi:hypothetical protein
MSKLACSYCNALNDAAEKTCVACGAPLDAPPLPRVETSGFQSTPLPPPVSSVSSERPQEAFPQAEKLYSDARQSLRTAGSITADAMAIACVAFALGLVGALTGMGFWGVAGATAVGLIIGFAEQSFWLTLLGAPLGALSGIVLWAIARGVGANLKGMVLVATLLAGIGALVGARQRTTPLVGCGGSVRPVLGAIGGFSVSLIGLVIGLVIHSLVK